MLKQLQTYLEYGNHFCGIEHTSYHGESTLHITVLKKVKKQLTLADTFHVNTLEELSTKLQGKQHIFLVINNDQVLTKSIKSNQTELSKFVFSAFPNINLDDFYCDVLTQAENQFISICRKTYVDELISEYKSLGFSVINIALGNTVVANVTNFIEDDVFYTSNTSFSKTDTRITAIQKTDNIEPVIYNINGLSIDNNTILSLSGALNTLLPNFQPLTNYADLSQSLKSTYIQSRTFRLALKIGLVTILAMLLVNFAVFNHYFNRVNMLQQTSQVNQTTKQNLLKLNVQVSKSQKMVDDMLKSSASKSAFYTNTIIQSLPESVLLSEFNYQPLLKRIKEEQHVVINTNTILISGTSNNSEIFSIWLTDLENISWVQQVDILNYEDRSKSLSNFSIKLIIADENQD